MQLRCASAIAEPTRGALKGHQKMSDKVAATFRMNTPFGVCA
jgi:hypothetical protein